MVVGLSSMGERRVRDLQKLHPYRIICVDTREVRAVAGKRFGIETVLDVNDAMKTNPLARLSGEWRT